MIARLEQWFTPQRVLVVALALGPFIIAAELAFIWSQPANRWKFPLGHDFVAFWTAARLWWEGGLAHVYDLKLFAARQMEVSVRPGLLLWHYPPVYLMLVLPFGLLPFWAGFLTFTAGGLAAFGAVAQRVRAAPSLLGRALLLGAPVMAATFVQGQNGFYAAALMIGGTMAREAGRTWLAACLFALFLAKPQLGVLIPVALIAAGDWRLIGRTLLAGLALLALTTLVLGARAWPMFLANTATLGLALSDHELLAQMPTLWATLTLLGLPPTPALAAQALSALFGIFAVWRVWRRSADADLRLAVLLAATLLVSPYGFRYDMVLTHAGAMLLLRRGWHAGFLPAERAIQGFLWAWPALFPPIALATGLQTGLAVSLLATAACLRRLRAP